MNENYTFPFSISPEFEVGPSSSPELALMAAVLERAHRDLEPNAPKEDTRSAIRWFFSSSATVTNTEERYLTFEDVAEALQLSGVQVLYLRKKALATKERLVNSTPPDENKLHITYAEVPERRVAFPR